MILEFLAHRIRSRPIRQKCNRARPCETCSNLGLSTSCTYHSPSIDGRREKSQSVQGASAGVQDRIHQLEKSVVSLASMLNVTKQAPQSSTTSATENVVAAVSQNQAGSPDLDADYHAQIPAAFGRISLENAETSYVDSTHWTAILDSVGILLFIKDSGSTPDVNDANGKLRLKNSKITSRTMRA